jgi:uncharacterized GH25 family protein
MTGSGDRPVRALAALLSGLASSGFALAHDFWIEPSSFHPARGSEVSFALRVGQDFRGDPVPRDDRRILGFALISAAGVRPIAGLPAADPAGLARMDEPGWIVVAYRSARSPVTLDPAKFEQYLIDENLDGVLAARRRRSESGKPGNEVFSRCAKSLVAVGGDARGGFDRVVGLTLELVAEKSPTAVASSGRRMPVRLFYEGRPLEGALVVAINRAEPGTKLRARTRPDGRAALELGRGGVWLVKAVHMVPAPKETGADWESLWASLTFEVP